MEPLSVVTWCVVFFLALLAGLYLIVGVVEGVDKMRAHPPPVAAIIILASAVFAGWVLVVSVPKPQKTQKQVAQVVAIHACSAENEGRPCEVGSPSRR